jgi:hypothetical protein
MSTIGEWGGIRCECGGRVEIREEWMMLRLVLWGVGVLAFVVVLDRLLLWMERRGWVYYRRTRSRGGGALYHMLDIHRIYDPGIEHVKEITYAEEQREDESGDPPVAERDENGPFGDCTD